MVLSDELLQFRVVVYDHLQLKKHKCRILNSYKAIFVFLATFIYSLIKKMVRKTYFLIVLKRKRFLKLSGKSLIYQILNGLFNNQILSLHHNTLLKIRQLRWFPQLINFHLQDLPKHPQLIRPSPQFPLCLECCSDGAVTKDQSFRSTIKEQRSPQPLKFSLLSAIGLKDYLIQKYVFSRGEPTYEIVEQDERKVFKCQGGVDYPNQYKAEATFIEDEKHSVPTVIISLKNRSKYSGTVIYSHGNSSDLRGSLKFISAFAAQLPRFDYLVYDYTGYGRSAKRETTQQSIVEDLQLVIKSIRVPDEQIILWGFSLGSYPTVRVGRDRPFRGMILQSPLASVYSLFADQVTPYSTFEKDCFSLLEHIPAVNCFLVIAHSRTDETVPFSHGKTLFERYQMINSNPYCFLLEVDGLAHNQMHPLLCSPNKNEVRESFHNYLKLMVEQGQLPKARTFQLQKNKYFSNLGDLQSAEKVDVGDKNTIDETAYVPPPLLGQCHSIADLKGENLFEIDDISVQDGIELNYYMSVKAEEHKGYFKSSQQAKDQTEVESIPSEQIIPDILE